MQKISEKQLNSMKRIVRERDFRSVVSFATGSVMLRPYQFTGRCVEPDTQRPLPWTGTPYKTHPACVAVAMSRCWACRDVPGGALTQLRSGRRRQRRRLSLHGDGGRDALLLDAGQVVVGNACNAKTQPREKLSTGQEITFRPSAA